MNAPITASSENVHNSQSSAERRNYYHVFKHSVIGAQVWKNAHHFILVNEFFWYICETTERNNKICMVKSTGKYWMGVTFGHLIRIFMDWNFNIFFMSKSII